jgi:hypothetical protein
MKTKALWMAVGLIVGWLAAGGAAGARTPIEEVLRANIRSDIAIVRELREAKTFEALKESLWTIETDLRQQELDVAQ